MVASNSAQISRAQFWTKVRQTTRARSPGKPRIFRLGRSTPPEWGSHASWRILPITVRLSTDADWVSAPHRSEQTAGLASIRRWEIFRGPGPSKSSLRRRPFRSADQTIRSMRKAKVKPDLAVALSSRGNDMRMLRRATPERLSAFSDGVFAVLITVLVLELRPPELPTFAALTWLSYAVSYLFIAIVWTNHHYLMRYAMDATPRLLWFNFAHLFSMSLLPLSTAWMAVSRLNQLPFMRLSSS